VDKGDIAIRIQVVEPRASYALVGWSTAASCDGRALTIPYSSRLLQRCTNGHQKRLLVLESCDRRTLLSCIGT